MLLFLHKLLPVFSKQERFPEMKKKIISFALILVLVFALAPITTAAQAISVEIDGSRVVFTGQNPIMVGGRVLVPVRAVFEQLGFNVTWESHFPGAVTLTNDDYIVHITMGSADFSVNGRSYSLDAPAQIIGGSAMAPIRTVAERVGLYSAWDRSTQTILIATQPLPGIVRSYTFNHPFSTFEQPDINSPRISRFDAQTVSVVEFKEDGWALISTYRGPQWAFIHSDNIPRFDTQISLNNNNIGSQGAGVTVNNNIVSIYTSGTYFISGTLNDGQIRITAPQGAEVRLILHEASITNPTGAAIYTVNAVNLHVITSENTWNSLRNGNASTVGQQAALYTRGYTTLRGEGILTVRSDNNRGISSRRNLNITSGIIEVNSHGNGIHVERYLGIHGGTLEVHTTGRFGRGIRSDHTANIYGGNININSSYEGIEAYFINIHGGYIDIYAVDDGINITYRRGLITIYGGEIYINARGDGIDSNNAITIRGGRIFISADGACPMGQAIDLEGHENFRLYGGTIAGTGTIWSNVPRGHAAQPTININFRGRFAAGVEISLVSSANEKIVEFTSMRAFGALIITSPDLAIGQTYYLYFDGTRILSVRLNQVITSLTH